MSVLHFSALSQAQAVRSIEYSQKLMRMPSVTPNDNGCQAWLKQKLSTLGFECHQFQVNGVTNLVASLGQGPRTFAFAGHTDVVPPGPLHKWKADPFAAEIIDGELIGRGAADMKTGVAAMLAAIESLLMSGHSLQNRFLWLITSDEEGEAEYGSKEIKKWLDRQGIQIDKCIVGEPTASLHTGDAIKVGRRGAISARVKIKGRQGHVAYPQYADNAIHKMTRVLSALTNIQWDQGSEDFPGTSLQVTHIDSGDFTDNIVPARCSICFNIRYSHRYNQQQLFDLVQAQIEQVTQEFDIEWQRPCEPYFTNKGGSDSLIAEVEQAIYKNTGKFPVLSTAGGTSDGRFFASELTQVVEIGVPNQSIHQINERIHITELATLENIYRDLLQAIL